MQAVVDQELPQTPEVALTVDHDASTADSAKAARMQAELASLHVVAQCGVVNRAIGRI
ncbi:hypothetical protein BDI4_300023 [Burkholderia diffusa]|nr:hypothetical protein BDI4_300023 [Burkholderia diffusa]